MPACCTGRSVGSSSTSHFLDKAMSTQAQFLGACKLLQLIRAVNLWLCLLGQLTWQFILSATLCFNLKCWHSGKTWLCFMAESKGIIHCRGRTRWLNKACGYQKSKCCVSFPPRTRSSLGQGASRTPSTDRPMFQGWMECPGHTQKEQWTAGTGSWVLLASLGSQKSLLVVLSYFCQAKSQEAVTQVTLLASLFLFPSEASLFKKTKVSSLCLPP